jgi:hypothetical protein
VLYKLFFERAPNAIGLLETRVLTYQKLDALVLEVVVHYTLVVAGNADTPLLELSNYALATLLSHSRDVTLRSCILETQIISVSHKNVSDSVKNWTRWRSCKNSVGVAIKSKIISLRKPLEITFCKLFIFLIHIPD